MRLIFIYLALFLSVTVNGQAPFYIDTVQIKEVVISKKILNSEHSVYRKIELDSSLIENYSHGTLNEILSENSGITVKSYGMGGSATPSLRGSGAGHTKTTWNGINLNYPMSGQSDLSLIPVGLIDAIQLYPGGASMNIGTGGIGGIINLETKPEWKDETSIAINPGAGSFGQYTGLIKVKTGNSRFHSATKAYLHSAVNNFRYLNDVIGANPVWQTRKNSQVLQKGFIQELYYRKSNSSTSVRVWYQSANRNLPSSMVVQQDAGEKQFDESLRTMLGHEIYKGRTSYSFTSAFISSTLNYSNQLAEIDSRNKSGTLILKAAMERWMNDCLKFKLSLDEELSSIKSNNYDKNKTRNSASISASFDRICSERFGFMVLARGLMDNSSILIPDFSAGIQFRLLEEKSYFLKANFSRNSKLPSMNDLFWTPGGNPDLKNEHALLYEVGFDMDQKISQSMNFRYNVTLYRNEISDMIQWHPGEFSYWTADNIQDVTTMGLESTLSLDYSTGKLGCRLNAGYSFTKAMDNDLSLEDNNGSKQLIYIPQNQANSTLRISYSRLYSAVKTNFTGLRYTMADNSRSLPGYVLNSFLAGYRIILKNNFADVNFTIDNLFNVTYQTIAYYPLPGRSYSLKLLIQFNK